MSVTKLDEQFGVRAGGTWRAQFLGDSPNSLAIIAGPACSGFRWELLPKNRVFFA
jgi:hypothetical protein